MHFYKKRFVITCFWVTPKFFFFSSKKKNKKLHGAVLNGTVQLLLPCACNGREEEDFWKCFSRSLSLSSTCIKPCQNPYPHNHTLPTPTQPYPANVTIKERDTMPCKHGRPPYPAEVRQPVSPLHHDGTEQGGHLLFLLINRRGAKIWRRNRGQMWERGGENQTEQRGKKKKK